LRDTIAPGTIGDPHDDMNDFPLIRDAGEKPRTKARKLGRTNSEHDDERFDASDFDPPPVTDPSEFGFEAGNKAKVKRDRFELHALDDIVVGDDPTELIPDILPMGPALGVVYGPPKSLKSFFATHAGLHIAGNLLYCGREVQSGAVAYVTSEGTRGARRRLVAARRTLGLEGKGVPFFFVPAMPNLGAGAADREELQRKIWARIKDGVPLRMLVIDTMRRAMPGKSENKQEDISIIVENCEALAREFNCLVVLVHHSPRSDDDRGSGSNATDGAADVMIGCKRDEVTKIATVAVHRLKDGEEGATWQFELRPIEVGIDRDGNPIRSCYVEITQEPERQVAAKAGHVSPLGMKFLNALHNALAGDDTVMHLGRRAVTLELWKAECFAIGILDRDKLPKQVSALWSKYRLELIAANRIACDDKLAWLV
jgi:hypothetical protein